MCSAVGIGWRPKFATTDVPMLHKLVRDHPLGVLTTHLSTNASLSPPLPLLQATHVPFVLDTPETSSENGDPQLLGMLRGHIARKNPHAKALMNVLPIQIQEDGTEEVEAQTIEQEIMIVFNSPIDSYVSPSYYTHTKPLNGKVVPTWFFSSVQVYGTLTIHASPRATSTQNFLKKQVVDLTRHGEEYLMGFPESKAWKVSDAPEKFAELLMNSIVGLEVKITRIEGKGKFGQEIDARDQMGCIRSFEALGTDTGRKMAHEISQCMRKDEKRVAVYEAETKKDLVQARKVKGPFGWYYPTSEAEAPCRLDCTIGIELILKVLLLTIVIVIPLVLILQPHAVGWWVNVW
jgi:transcriptional regulator